MTDSGLPRTVRLLTPAEYQQVFAEGKRLHAPGFTLVFRPIAGSSTRLGLAIAKKQVRLAHQRNRIKRLIRESFRRQRLALSGGDLVFLAKPGLAEFDNARVNDSLRQLFSRIIAPAPIRGANLHGSDPSAANPGAANQAPKSAPTMIPAPVTPETASPNTATSSSASAEPGSDRAPHHCPPQGPFHA